MSRVILASASPRRYELLVMLGARELLVRPAKNEIDLPDMPPGEAVAAVALGKALEVYAPEYRDDVVIAADTAVLLDGAALGKPADAAQARDMLLRLSGRAHTVYTGVAVLYGGARVTAFEATRVYFRELSDGELEAYIRTGEPMDKAGAYGAQGRGAVFIERIEGDFFNVMGLPLCRLDRMLRELGAAYR